MSRWPCKDYLRWTCNNSFCERWHPPECLSYKTKIGCRFGEKCSYAHRQVDEQPTKRSQKEWWQKCSSHGEEAWVALFAVTHVEHQRPVVCSSSSTRQLGCVFQDMEPPRLSSILRKSSDMPKPIQTCKIHESCCTSRIHSRPKPFARMYLPRWTSPAWPQRSQIWGSVSRRDRVARARCPRSSVEAGQKCFEFRREKQSNIFLTLGKKVLACITS